MRISIGNDHAGVEHKKQIQKYLFDKNIEINNYGTDSLDSVDYPDFAHPVSKDINNQSSDLGILICGSGNGAAMTANKRSKIRAALCWNEELSILARRHNDANIISIPARFVTLDSALKMVKLFLKTKFDGGRHQKRVDKISSSL